MIATRRTISAFCFSILFVPACSTGPQYDVVIRNGRIYDGRGGVPFVGDIALEVDSIVAVGSRLEHTARNRAESSAVRVGRAEKAADFKTHSYP